MRGKRMLSLALAALLLWNQAGTALASESGSLSGNTAEEASPSEEESGETADSEKEEGTEFPGAEDTDITETPGSGAEPPAGGNANTDTDAEETPDPGQEPDGGDDGNSPQPGTGDTAEEPGESADAPDSETNSEEQLPEAGAGDAASGEDGSLSANQFDMEAAEEPPAKEEAGVLLCRGWSGGGQPGEDDVIGSYADFSSAVAAIDALRDSRAVYTIVLLSDVGEASAPVTVNFPSRAAEVTVAGAGGGENRKIYYVNQLTLKCPLVFDRVEFCPMTRRGEGAALGFRTGAYDLTFRESTVGTKEGMALGSLAGNGKKAVTFDRQEIAFSGNITGAGQVVLKNGSAVRAKGTFKVSALDLEDDSVLEAGNVTVSGGLSLRGGRLRVSAGGNGKLNQVLVGQGENCLEAGTDAKGNSRLTISGQVRAEEPEAGEASAAAPLLIAVRDGDSSGYARLVAGMSLLNAPKAAASWFCPLYTADGRPGMGEPAEGYDTYKEGKSIRYGRMADMEVRLHGMESEESGQTAAWTTCFKTFEEAVSEIQSLCRYRSGTKKYEDYQIELLGDVEIGNRLGNGAYSALTLPSRAGEVRIFSGPEGVQGDADGAGGGYRIRFAGKLTIRCNLVLENVRLCPMKRVRGTGVPAASAWALGKYTLTLDRVATVDEEGNTLVRKISGSSASGCLKLQNGRLDVSGVSGLREVRLAGGSGLYTTGNYSVYQTCFAAEKGEQAVLETERALTMTLIRQEGEGEAVIRKSSGGAFTLKGADVKRDGGKEKAAVLRELGSPKVTVQIMAESCTPGMKVLTCKYLVPDDLFVKDRVGFWYDISRTGNVWKIGSGRELWELELGDKTLQYAMASEDYVYSGRPIEPVLQLVDEGRLLTEGTEYTVSYQNNVNAGRAAVRVEGMPAGGYAGSAEISFEIQKKNLGAGSVAVCFSGLLTRMTPEEEEELFGEGTDSGFGVPKVQVEDEARFEEERILREGAEYTVAYSTDGGAVLCATVEGAGGNYEGSRTLRFAELKRQKNLKILSCTADSGTYDAEAGTMALQASFQAGTSGAAAEQPYLVRLGTAGKQTPRFFDREESADGVVRAVLTSKDGFRSCMMDKYVLAVIEKDGYRLVSSNEVYLETPEVTAVTDRVYTGFYEGELSSKKGMQGTHSNATVDLDIQAALLNLRLNEMIRSSRNVSKFGEAAYEPYVYKGKTYYFHNMISYMETVLDLNGWAGTGSQFYGVHRNVSLNLLLGWDAELKYLIHPSARSSGHRYYALNMKDQEARETYEALFCYMAERLGGTRWRGQGPYKYRVCNWILGNEVNACKVWNYSGSLSAKGCADNYAEAFQLLYQGVRRTDANARVFISLDHDWNAGENGHGGKAYLDEFAAYMYQKAPHMHWNVNYHPYSQPLTRNDFWNDSANTTTGVSTRFISMKNLKVLTNYLGILEKKYFPGHENEEYIRVILGEQGFIAANKSQEPQQAAAIGYGFYLASVNTRVDAYIIRAYNDDPAEGVMTLGVMYRGDAKKEAYDVYKKLGTEESLTCMDRYRGRWGIPNKSWTQIVPGLTLDAVYRK